MSKAALLGVILMSLLGCQSQQCIDCVDNAGNRFTFCDPPESPFANMDCGEEYTQ